MIEKYWKVLRYSVDPEYNERYPIAMIVKIKGEDEEHFWRLPGEVIDSDSYDWSEAIKTNNLWGEI